MPRAVTDRPSGGVGRRAMRKGEAPPDPPPPAMPDTADRDHVFGRNTQSTDWMARAALTDHQRTVFALTMRGMKPAATATRLGVTPMDVASDVRAALVELTAARVAKGRVQSDG